MLVPKEFTNRKRKLRSVLAPILFAIVALQTL